MSGTQYNLPERIVKNYNDVVAESGIPDKVVIAMGVNDLGLTGILDGMNNSFDLLRTVYDGEVFVLNSFNPSAPTISTAYQSFTDDLISAIGDREGFTFVDISELSYSKFDTVHPDDEGHATIAEFLYPYLVDESKYLDTKIITSEEIEDLPISKIAGLEDALIDVVKDKPVSVIKNLHKTSDPTSLINESNIINAWSKNNTSLTLSSDNTDSVRGALSLKASKTVAGSAVFYTPNYTVELGKEYIFTCKVKVGGGFITGSTMYSSEKSGAFVQTPIDHTITEWQTLTQTLSFSKERTRFTFSMSVQEVGAFLLVDDIEFYEVSDTIKAFPNAEGFGAISTGGRTGTVKFVTNLNDSGAGSLREACSTSFSYIVFLIAGTIELDSPIFVESNVSIYGQTAFRNGGQGITLRASSTNEASLMVFNSGNENLVIQYIRFRRGMTPFVTSATAGQTLALTGDASKIIVDHCSFGWDEDESLTIWGVLDVTVSNSTITNSLKVNQYGREKTSKSLIIGNGSDRVSIYTTLIGNADQRNALFGGSTLPIESFEFKNNLIFNWGNIGTDFLGGQLPLKVNIIGNKWKIGNNSILNRHGLRATGNTGDKFYLKGNINLNRPTDDLDEWLAIGDSATPSANLSTTFQELTPFDFPLENAKTYSIEELEGEVLNQMGASLYVDKPDRLSKRDYLDGTGSHINNQEDVGGFPTLSDLTSPIIDPLNIGIDEEFANAHGITSSNQIKLSYDFGTWIFDNSLGYEAIEVYAYWLTKN